MSRRNDDAALLDLLNATRLVIRFRGDLGHAAFLEDPKTQSAILHQLLIYGRGRQAIV